MQSVPIATKVVSSNPVHGEVYTIQHNVIKLVSDATDRWFSLGTPVSSINKTDHRDITEIVLKVALNTINQQSKVMEHGFCFDFYLQWCNGVWLSDSDQISFTSVVKFCSISIIFYFIFIFQLIGSFWIYLH